MTSSLRSGTRLGPYRIVAPLGAGGMGEVYRAHDAKLDRPVALKILPAEVVRDAERIRRFVQEAKAASSLSHPNIVTIYDIGEAVPREAGTEGSEGDTPAEGSAKVHFIAMELVEGQTLRQLLDDRSIEPRTLLAYLAQAAEGLAKAHAAGIVHRDLKPENVMVSRDGYAKVLDFGLAKLTEPSVSGSALAAAPTALAEDNTRDGAVMGTIGYMSPEQAMGKPVDHRTDLFAFGCLLYEAATGKRPFTGESSVDVLHAIVRETPTPVEQIAPRIPRALVRRIRRCLEKDPAKRAQSMKDLAFELHDLTEEWETLATPSGTVSSASSLSTSAPPVRGGIGRAAWIAIGVATVAVTALAVSAVVLWRGRSAPAPPPTGFQQMTIRAATSTGDVTSAALSPDGRYLVFVRAQPAGPSLWLRLLATDSDVELLPPQGTRLLMNPVVTADGNFILYLLSDELKSIGTLYRMPLLGGDARKLIVDIDSAPALSPDGKRIAFLRNVPTLRQQDLVVASSDGSGAAPLATRRAADHRGFHVLQANSGPAWSPDGRSLAVPGFDASGALRNEFVLVDAASGQESRIDEADWFYISGPAWLPDGRALLVAGTRGRTLADPQLWRLPLGGVEPTRITNDSQIYRGVSASADGRILASVQVFQSSTLWRRPLRGADAARPLTSSSRERVWNLAASSDGSLFFGVIRGDVRVVARLAPDAEQPTVLTSADTPSFAPSVSRDGRTVLIHSLLPDGRYLMRVMDREGSGVRELPERGALGAYSLHPDGTWYLAVDQTGHLWRQPLDGGEATLFAEQTIAGFLGFSPDGRRIGFTYNKTPDAPTPQYFAAVASADGGPLRIETEFPIDRLGGAYQNFKWAPDGQGVTASKPESAGTSLWRIPLADGPAEKIAEIDADRIGDYLISPDGETLYYTKLVETKDAVLLENFR